MTASQPETPVLDRGQPSPAERVTPAAASPRRIASLDQFRGYTIAGMFVVNFIGGFTVSSYLLMHHNTFCSYADTIMPHFIFGVGFAFRLSFGRRALTQGVRAAYWRVVRRLIGLGLVALFVFQFDGRLLPTYWYDLVSRGAWSDAWRPFNKNWTQTLFQIAMATLWIVPVIRLRARWRVLYLLLSAGVHVAINYAGYLTWLYAPISGHTGGPLGCMTWSIPALVGTLTCDAIADATGRPRIGRLFAWSFLLMALAYLMSCGTRWYDVPPDRVGSAPGQELAEHPVVPDNESFGRWKDRLAAADWSAVLAEPPFVAPPDTAHRRLNYWMMSVKGATLSFMTFNAGFSLFVYLLFYVACDIWGWQLGMFRTLGVNALAGYLIQWPTDEIFTDLTERSSTAWAASLGYSPDAVGRSAPALFVAVAFVLFFAVNWAVLRWMEKKKIFFKV